MCTLKILGLKLSTLLFFLCNPYFFVGIIEIYVIFNEINFQIVNK